VKKDDIVKIKELIKHQNSRESINGKVPDSGRVFPEMKNKRRSVAFN
jgi:hypothetical protein